MSPRTREALLIKGGDLDQFALQLAAQNPGQVEPVVRLLVAERDTHRREVCDFITRLLESDALDRWQIDDQVRWPSSGWVCRSTACSPAPTTPGRSRSVTRYITPPRVRARTDKKAAGYARRSC